MLGLDLPTVGGWRAELTFMYVCVFVRMEASQERIRTVKESLQSCKNLLHCKRDELRRLWIEGVEMKTVYASLDAVEQVKDVAEQIPALIASRKYLLATERVISSLAVLDTELSDVDALQQVEPRVLIATFRMLGILKAQLGIFWGFYWVWGFIAYCVLFCTSSVKYCQLNIEWKNLKGQ